MPHPLEKKVLAAIRRHELIASGDRILIAVSGGIDSVCLLHILAALRRPLKMRIGVAHLNHRLRGGESNADECFVKDLCGRLKIPFHVRRSDVMKLAQRNGVSIEMAARDARLRFYRDLARREGYSAVATGHTADDQAETIVMRLARGTGTRGLGAIRHASDHGRLRLVRPLRDVTRASLEEYARRAGLEWREDLSNRDPAFTRNRVRHDVIPAIRDHLNPRFTEAACRAGDLLAADEAWLDALADGILEEVLEPARGEAATDALLLAGLLDHPLAAQRRVIRKWLGRAGIDVERLGWDVVDRILRITTGRRGGRRVPVGGASRVVRDGEALVIQHGELEEPPRYRSVVPVPGECVIEAASLRVVTWYGDEVIRDRTGEPGRLPARATINAAKIGRRGLYLRTWRSGDRMRPLGMRGTRKLQDIFVDAKLDRDARKRIPILTCGQDIVWLPGYRISADWAVTNPEREALQILIDPLS